MATKARPTSNEQEIAMHFPLAGVDLSMPLERQPARPLGDGKYARTTPIGVNVRGYEAVTGRQRGGARCGLARYIATPVVTGWIIQHVKVLVTTAEAALS